MLIWNRELWLIDHGASLYFHHSWDKWKEQAKRPFVQIKNHVLLADASKLDVVDQEFSAILTEERIQSIVSLIPDEWLLNDDSFETPDEFRKAYTTFLNTRIKHSEIFVKEAENARK